uniref:Uncharacterized protein n=1 Tax=Brachymonas petroleovorans TaxID=240505 RepID=Q5VJ92_9BURK|nr:hypothetical protein [Brachymonas petroleovorans]
MTGTNTLRPHHKHWPRRTTRARSPPRRSVHAALHRRHHGPAQRLHAHPPQRDAQRASQRPVGHQDTRNRVAGRRVKAQNLEGKLRQHLLDHPQQVHLADGLHAGHHLPLRDAVHRVDVVQPLGAVLVALVHAVDADMKPARPWGAGARRTLAARKGVLGCAVVFYQGLAGLPARNHSGDLGAAVAAQALQVRQHCAAVACVPGAGSQGAAALARSRRSVPRVARSSAAALACLGVLGALARGCALVFRSCRSPLLDDRPVAPKLLPISRLCRFSLACLQAHSSLESRGGLQAHISLDKTKGYYGLTRRFVRTKLHAPTTASS